VSAPAADLGAELVRVARRAPERPALADRGRALTYGELLDAALPLADGLGPGAKPVALLMPHGADAVVAIAAALIARRPYCPLNPAQPRRRIEALLDALEPATVWAADAELRRKLALVGLESSAPSAPPRPTGTEPDGSPRGDDICAVYATSGTTGEARLVGYRAAATAHRAVHYAAALGAVPGDRFSLASPLWTAASASALFTALRAGASLELIEPAGHAPADLASRVAASAITVWHSTPSLFRRLGATGALEGHALRAIRLGGEPLAPGDVELARRICGDEALLVTGYSLTEANGAVTQCTEPLGGANGAGAGHPIAGVVVTVEDADGAALAPGEEGEIVVAGPNLSAGYLGANGRADGTRFSSGQAGTVLRTGDRGVLREDGSLEVRGRIDRRVKVSGHRVDPAEIEAAAQRHASVTEAAAVPFAADAGATALALFATGKPGLEAGELRAFLREQLPPEARPAVVRPLGRLPLTAGGKIDRERLSLGAATTPPSSGRRRTDPVVDHIVGLFAGALELDAPQPEDDLFALGGDSLAAAEVCAGIEATYGVSLEPAALLRHGTAERLGARVRAELEGAAESSASVLHLNPGGDRPPLVVVPGAGSDATALVHFAEACGPDQPIDAIQLPGADGRTRALTRMDRIIAHCRDAVRTGSAGPPYRLAGTSFGGQVAYGIATELLRAGVEVEYLGLFDAPAPSLRRAGPAVQWPPGRRRERYRSAIALRLGTGWQPPTDLRFRHLRAACLTAARSWEPAPIAMPLHLYRCDEQPQHLASAPSLGWERHASDIVLRPLATRHGRHIRPPAVEQLAARVTGDLAATAEPR
jgi:acyl-CoA synthetase (AMP-forming)/AMP-acid ligase II/thioesterase domain-containing protein